MIAMFVNVADSSIIDPRASALFRCPSGVNGADLCGAVEAAARIRLVPRHGADVDDVAPVAGDHARRKHPREQRDARHVRLQHRVHVLRAFDMHKCPAVWEWLRNDDRQLPLVCRPSSAAQCKTVLHTTAA